MVIGVFGSLVVGVLILFFAQKIKENRYKIIIRILGFLFLALPILVGLWNNYIPKIFNNSIPDTQIENNAPALVSSTPETTGWQTYSNSQYSFEIKYPRNWEAEITQIGTVRINNLESDSYFEIIENRNPEKFSLDDWFRETTTIGGRSTVKASAQAVTINGIKAYRLDSDLQLPDSLFEIVGIANAEKRIFSIYTYSEQTSDNNVLNQMLSTFKFTANELSGYELIRIPFQYGFGREEGDIYEFNADLNDDGKKELIRFYWDTGGQNDICEKTKPIVMKIFSGSNTSNEVFGFDYKDNNLIGGAEIFQNFWGDGSNVVMGEGIGYACGSGYRSNIMFFVHRQEGQYQAIPGPELSGTGGSSVMYKFAGENGLGKKIITAEAYWSQNSVDYCAGCEHKLQFTIYNWNGQGYTKTLAGITQNKYLSETIDQILQKEPSVLNQ